MGLASALSTALTGLTAAETTIDVVGNNLANSGTVGFKASKAVFATQFLQTQSLGSQPTANSGGNNPRQIGLGTQVAEIVPNFNQGTIEISSNPSDMAIQGDGFFIVQGNGGETLYSRNGIFKLNAQNELVSITGNRVLGFGVDDDFQIQPTVLQPIVIPLGAAAVAQATRNVVFEGALTPTGDLADTAQIIQSSILGDSQFDAPTTTATDNVSLPPTLGTMAGAASGAGPLGPGTYSYRVVFVDSSGRESEGSTLDVTLGGGPNGIELTDIPTDGSGNYVGRRIYRSVELGSLAAGATPTYYLVKDLSADNTSTTLTASGLGVDTVDDATLVTGTALDTTSLTGNYSYYVTWVAPGVEESRPSALIGPRNVSSDRILLSNFPAPTGEYAVPGAQVRIYRNLANNSDTFFRVAEVDPADNFVDYIPDSTISDGTLPGYVALDADGPKIDGNTLLVNVLRRDGSDYNNMFQEGVLSFAPRKGGRSLDAKELTITSTTTVQELIDFMEDVTGIQDPTDDANNPIAVDSSGASPGGSVTAGGQIRFVSNNGVDNAITMSLSSFELHPTAGSLETPNLGFGTIQEAVGESAVADFIVYDSLGIPLNVRVTTVMESRNSSSTTYRWFADSPDNDPVSGNDISVGTGLITFDGEGNVIEVSNSTVSIERRNVSSVSPLEFDLDFSAMSGLATTNNVLAASRQDGSGAGTLASFIVGEDGIIRGVFNNGVTRDLGQMRLARFGNPTGLEQRGENLFAAGVNSGLPVQGNPGEQGIGSIIAGALELSNTDIGRNLIDLILASTQYRGNTRVVTTSQQLLDELLALRR